MTVESYKTNEYAALRRARADLQAVADKRQDAVRAIRRRMDLDHAAQEKLVALATAAAAKEYREVAGRVRKTIESASATLRKARRRDEWDTTTEQRIAAATARWLPLLTADENGRRSIEDVATKLINEADADGDTATLLSLRRELPMAARRMGLATEAVEQIRERLDLLTPDRSIGEATALARELSEGLPRLEHTLSAVEYELAGRGDAPILPDFDGSLSYRLGYSADSEGNVVAPRPPSEGDQERGDTLEEEYRRMFL